MATTTTTNCNTNTTTTNNVVVVSPNGASISDDPKPVTESLPENEKNALVEFKLVIREAISKNELLPVIPNQLQTPPPPLDPNPNPNPILEEENPPTTTSTEDEQQPSMSSVDEDGPNCKTVEAIEETVVSSSSSPKPSTQTLRLGNSTQPPNLSIWGIPLLDDERSDVLLWKFLRARDFKPQEAFSMLKDTLLWRKQFKIDEMMMIMLNEEEQDEELRNLNQNLGRAVFMHGHSKDGHPVCYNVYGEFQGKDLYRSTFSDEDKTISFLSWRILFLERSIRNHLDFRPGKISTILQVNDLRNSPGLFAKWELRQATKQALQMLQDNYPEFVAKQVFINVPWWYMAASKMISPFLTQRSKSKFVVAGSSKSAETLFNYIDAEQVPVQYGGLSRKDAEFNVTDTATHIIIKPASMETLEFSVTDGCHLTWELRVLGWDVSYGAEFVPNAVDAYTVIIQKVRKVDDDTPESIITGHFKVGGGEHVPGPGRLILTIDNATSKKKRLLYRLKSKPCLE